MTLKIAVIICTKNRANDLKITLDSLFYQTLLPNSLIIVDDSNDDVTENTIGYNSLQSQVCDIRYYRPSPSNSGLPAARNYGIRQVEEKMDLLVFLDDDVTLEKHYLESIHELFLSDPEVSGVGGYIISGYHNRAWHEKIFLAITGLILPNLVPASLFQFRMTKTGEALAPLFRKRDTSIQKTEWLSGCNMAYRSSLFREGNAFDENFIRYAQGEDILFSHQLYLKGKKMLIAYKAQISHRFSQENRTRTLIQCIMIFGYRKYLIQKFSGKGVAGSFYYKWFVSGFFMSSLILFLIRKKNSSYLKTVARAHHLIKPFEKPIEMDDISRFNAFFIHHQNKQ